MLQSIDILPFTQFLPGVFRAGVSGGVREAGAPQYHLGGVDACRLEVAQSYYACARYMGETFYSARTAHAKADKSDAHSVNRGCGKFKHVGLSFCALGHFSADGVVSITFYRCGSAICGTYFRR